METFATLLEQDISVMENHSNACLIGRVVNIRKKTYDIEIKGKGMIRCSFLNVPHLSKTLKIGDLTTVFPTDMENIFGNTTLDQGKAIEIATEDMTWSVLEKAYQENAPVPGRLLNAIPQGFSVGLGGLIGTLPKAHLCRQETTPKEKEWKDMVRPYLGKRLLFRILSLNRKKKLILLSRTALHDTAAS